MRLRSLRAQVTPRRARGCFAQATLQALCVANACSVPGFPSLAAANGGRHDSADHPASHRAAHEGR